MAIGPTPRGDLIRGERDSTTSTRTAARGVGGKEEKLNVIDTLTCTVDAMVRFEGPHSAPGFAKTISLVSGTKGTAASGTLPSPVSPSGGKHAVPAKRRSEMETIRRLQSQCLTQMQQIKLSDRARKRMGHAARIFAMRVMVRHLLKWHAALKLRLCWSRWTAEGLVSAGGARKINNKSENSTRAQQADENTG